MQKLIELMRRLRNPESGCPWDAKQTFETIAPYTIEEAYEVADAIARNDIEAVKEELGDLLFQVVFHAQIAEERGAFTFAAIVDGITEKMVRRHPHVFEPVPRDLDDAELERSWETIKAEERALKGKEVGKGLLDSVAKGLPALARAEKLQKRAASVGFDWPDLQGVLAKFHEEQAELEAEMAGLNGKEHKTQTLHIQRISEELGDVLFTCVNLARHVGINADKALRDTNHRFEKRFAAMEIEVKNSGRSVDSLQSADWEKLWLKAKRV